MNESTFWHYLRKGMEGRWKATRVENLCSAGMPDVVYSMRGVHGFIELKYIPEIPKRPTTPLSIPLRREQKIWIEERGSLAGFVWVFVKVQHNYYLFDHATSLYNAPEPIGLWCNHTVKQWVRFINFESLAKILS